MNLELHIKTKLSNLRARTEAHMSENDFDRAVLRALDLCRFPSEIILFVFAVIVPVGIVMAWYLHSPPTASFFKFLVVLLFVYPSSKFVFAPVGKWLCMYLTACAVEAEVMRVMRGKAFSISGLLLVLPSISIALAIIYVFMNY